MPENDFVPFRFRTDDGLTLYGRHYGKDKSGSLPIVCLSGLSRNSRDFHLLALRLAATGRKIVTLDYRGRGLSEWDANKDNYNIVREAQDVVLMLDSLGIDRAAFIGTSRGGLILHVLGAMIAPRIARIVFNDIGPVIESDGLKRIRDYLSSRQPVSNLAEAATHLKSIHGNEFSALADSDWSDMADAIYREIDGNLVPDFDSALVEPLKTIDFTVPLPDLWKQFDLLAAIPLLIIRGENSHLLSEQTVLEMQARHPLAQVLTARGQGHAPILHIPDVYGDLADFLNAK